MFSQDHAREIQTYSYRVVDAIFLRAGNPHNFEVIVQVLFQCANGDICASLQMRSIEIKYLCFSRVCRGRDVNE